MRTPSSICAPASTSAVGWIAVSSQPFLLKRATTMSVMSSVSREYMT
jgi:hypothetical protein